MPWGARDVQFDYDGALQLARDLWAGAGTVRQAHGAIDDLATSARTTWRGRFAEDFDGRHLTSMDNASLVAAAMCEEAHAWALGWKQAVDEQNRINRARAVEAERASRSFGERFVDHFVGDDSDRVIRAWQPVAVPLPPEFAPTGGLESF